MLTASGERSFGKSTLRSTFLFGVGFWAHAVERRGLCFDTRFLPASQGSSPRYSLQLVLDGTVEIFGPEARRLTGPVAVLMTEDQFEGANGQRSFTFRSFGEPFRAIDLRMAPEWLRLPHGPLPRAIELSSEVLALARAVTAKQPADKAGGAARALLAQLAAEGMIGDGLAARSEVSSRIARLWGALRPMAERFYSSPTLQEVSEQSGISLRQLARDVEDFVEQTKLGSSGWRDTTRRFRLKLAVVGLSAPNVGIAEIADAAGYGSTVAMARAFQDAGLPAPIAVREALRRASENVDEET
jgi:AraC-like DNA-binding protein